MRSIYWKKNAIRRRAANQVLSMLARNNNKPMSLQDFISEIKCVNAFNMTEVLRRLERAKRIERVKGDKMIPIGCMVRPETLYKLTGN